MVTSGKVQIEPKREQEKPKNKLNLNHHVSSAGPNHFSSNSKFSSVSPDTPNRNMHQAADTIKSAVSNISDYGISPIITRQNSGNMPNLRISGEKSIGELRNMLRPTPEEEPTLTCHRLNLNVRDSYTKPRH